MFKFWMVLNLFNQNFISTTFLWQLVRECLFISQLDVDSSKAYLKIVQLLLNIFTRFARRRKGPRLGNMQRRLKPRPGGRCMNWKIRWKSKSLLMICRRDEVMMSNIYEEKQRVFVCYKLYELTGLNLFLHIYGKQKLIRPLETFFLGCKLSQTSTLYFSYSVLILYFWHKNPKYTIFIHSP